MFVDIPTGILTGLVGEITVLFKYAFPIAVIVNNVFINKDMFFY
jgi:hypothetical protein